MDNQSTHLDSGEPENRAVIIAGLRAMADFLETRTDIPVARYTFVGLQHSVIDEYDRQTFQLVHKTDEEKVAEVRRIAGLLGVEARIHEDGSAIALKYKVADRTTFTVHANLDSGEQA